ncbi:MAG: response regulator [Candidatus Omnitrophica bacterium]|nr:response regulator [Candidatus Omnitrophota bacterium]
MKKILVVDDEKDIRELLVEKLNKHNFQALGASSGEEALALSKDNLFDIILLDVAMPGMDGYETCEKLKKQEKTNNTPVIFLTGKDLEPKAMSKRYHELCAAGYLPKPSTMSELLDKIKETIG